MRYFHDCGGIDAAGCAFDPLGWECVGMTEIEKFPIAVVKHHRPHTKQYGDTTKVSLDGANLDLLIGGTPCQGFSVAGKRGGLDDKRSNLAWNFLRLAAESNSRWIIWENVPGASSTNEGQDLLAFTQEVGKLGYGYAWRTLDAQFFGVPQRRRRIFLVGYLGDWRPAAAVLFESNCLSRNSQTSRKKRQTTSDAFEIDPGSNRATDIAPTLDARCKDGPIRNQVGLAVAHPLTAGPNRQADHPQENYIVVFENHAQDSRIKQVEICPQLNAKDGTGGNNLPLVMQREVSFDCVGTQVQVSTAGISQTLRSMGHDKSHQNKSSHLAVFLPGQSEKAGSIAYSEHLSPTLKSGDSGTNRTPALHAGGTVRRLTPRECERLQGFPDDYTLIPWKWKVITTHHAIGDIVEWSCPDSPRYKALGNSIAVPVLKHLGQRIAIVERLLNK